MQAAASSPPPAPTMADGAAAWGLLAAKLRERARLDAEIVELTGQVQRSGTIERLEGVPLDTVLSLTHRLPRADRAMQITAADVLQDMPATRRMFRVGTLSWGLVRGIVSAAMRLNQRERAVLDARIAASEDRLATMDPDEALDAVDLAATELRELHSAERAELRRAQAGFLWAQPGLLDNGRLYSEMDHASLATVLAGVDGFTPADDGRSLARRRVEGLVHMARHLCGDDPEGCEDPQASDRRARPSVVVHVDLNDVHPNAAGTVELNAPGSLPVLTARLVEALAGDGSVRAILYDGARPLAVTRKVWARDVPADVRFAVKGRDRGDRFPGSRAPVGQAHLHHLDRAGEGHDPDHLICLAPASHRRLHRHGWRVTLDPRTGEATFSRGERVWRTLPRGTRLRRAPPGNDQTPG